MLGISVIFELPVLIFFLTLIRVASPSFLMRHSRYAILAIVILAAVVTPSPDAFTMTLFAVPMILLYFLGVFASYLLVLRREGRKFPWKIFLIWLVAVLAVVGIAMAYTRLLAVPDEVARQHFQDDPAGLDAELQSREHGELAVDLVGFPKPL